MTGRPLVPLRERFMRRLVVQENGCWHLTGRVERNGYQLIAAGGGGSRRLAVHRVAYELFNGPIPKGLTVDHTCHNEDDDCEGGVTCPHRRCVNPAHLEAVGLRENILRGGTLAAANAAKTHCPQNHEYTPENTYILRGGRSCRACSRARTKAWQKRNRERDRAKNLARDRAYYARNRERVKARAREYRARKRRELVVSRNGGGSEVVAA
jgi:hypothetical protein